MSKKTFFQRTKSIIKKLKQRSFVSYEEIEDYIEREMQYFDQDEEFSYSKRTFQRDIQEIRDVWGIHIEYSKSNLGYFINQDYDHAIDKQKLFEIFEMMNALDLTDDLKQYVIFENKQPSNTHYFDDILQAIKNKTYLKISHLKFGASEPTHIKVAPYGLKEHKNRWYLIVTINEKLRTYSLDRIISLSITPDKFQPQAQINFHQLFEHVLGIFRDENQPVEEIVLRVQNNIVPYLQTLPIHPSQKEISTNEEFTDFSLQLIVTQDLLIELKSYGFGIEVLAPQHLRQKIVKDLEQNLALYNKKSK